MGSGTVLSLKRSKEIQSSGESTCLTVQFIYLFRIFNKIYNLIKKNTRFNVQKTTGILQKKINIDSGGTPK